MENEKILGVFPVELSGRYLIRCYDAYFTNQRLIGSYVQSRTWTRHYGGFLFWSYRLFDYIITVPLTKRKGVKPPTDPERILKSDKRNFAWNYQQDIKAIEFKRKRGTWGQYLISVELMNGKQRIVCYDRKHGSELSKLMEEVMPGKVTIKAI